MYYKRFIKPFFDIVTAIILLLVLSPLIITTILVLLFVNKGSPFFFQTRAGYHSIPFRIVKFKTMKDDRDANGDLLPDSKRLTRVGHFLRKASVDELPQLFNVLKGELSIVGPRPLLMQYLPHYNEEQAKRHNVKPGITGWAQVHGRQSLPFTGRFDLDVWYVRNISFKLDVKIIVKTIINIIKSEGIIKDEEFWKI